MNERLVPNIQEVPYQTNPKTETKEINSRESSQEPISTKTPTLGDTNI